MGVPITLVHFHISKTGEVSGIKWTLRTGLLNETLRHDGSNTTPILIPVHLSPFLGAGIWGYTDQIRPFPRRVCILGGEIDKEISKEVGTIRSGDI